ncbi:predicted protein [Histoplasma capsulatum var. duboisii H88]|uniref:Predicted protein n=2 Tax=Ajellomyces capsulatus TaxID=5037 RepID=F0UNA8_AJEC8|nr:predicted protein [Histoplasma capsulatum H143]EGC47566.1 predicted protein [Histoplasma capsulatum var. duboisii H88]
MQEAQHVHTVPHLYSRLSSFASDSLRSVIVFHAFFLCVLYRKLICSGNLHMEGLSFCTFNPVRLGDLAKLISVWAQIVQKGDQLTTQPFRRDMRIFECEEKLALEVDLPGRFFNLPALWNIPGTLSNEYAEPPFRHIHLGLLIVFCKILAQICLLLRHSDYKSSDGATRMMQCKHSDLKTPNTRPTQCLRTLAGSLSLLNVRRLKDLATNPHTYLCTSLLVLQCRYGIYSANYDPCGIIEAEGLALPVISQSFHSYSKLLHLPWASSIVEMAIPFLIRNMSPGKKMVMPLLEILFQPRKKKWLDSDTSIIPPFSIHQCPFSDEISHSHQIQI